MRYYFKSANLIGDALCISPAWRQWIKEHPYNPEQDVMFMDTLPDHVAPLYAGMVRDLVPNLQTVHFKPDGPFDFEHVFDVNAAFKISDEQRSPRKWHVIESYAELLGVTLEGEQLAPGEYDTRLKVTYIPDYKEDGLTEQLWNSSESNRLLDCILISMFSASCTSQDPKIGIPNKMLPFDKWKPLLRYLRDVFPETPVRFLGGPQHMVPNGYAQDIVRPGEYMLGVPLNRLALIMKNAKLVVTIDNGMSHLAASQEARTFLMYPTCLGLHYILPVGNPNLEWIQMNPVYISPAQLLFRLKKAVEKFKLVEVV